MQSLKFTQLLLLSNSTRSANRFKFKDRMNLITADDNSVGKSSLVKLIFYALGCETTLDSTWQNLDCKVLLCFEVGNNKFQILRYKNSITLKENDKTKEVFSKITGDYSKRFASIVGFQALLPRSNSDEFILDTPPPAYYFVPYYIDQIKSWAKAWDNFENLGQFQDWRKNIIKYHVGLLKPDYFEYEEKVFEKKNKAKLAEVSLNRIQTTLDVVGSYVPPFLATIDKEVFSKMTLEIEESLRKLTSQQEEIFGRLSKDEGNKVYLEHQKNISEKIIKELDDDYKFTIEYLPDDEVVCPLCGVVHENSIINRASILTDKQQAESQLENIQNDLDKTCKSLVKNKIEIEKVRSAIDVINSKYVLHDEEDKEIPLVSYIDAFAVSSVQLKVEGTKIEKAAEIKLLEGDISDIKKEQKELYTKEDIELINNTFQTTLQSFVSIIDAEAVNLSEVNSPTDYNKIVKEGGAADGTRAVLAYYLAVYSIIEKFGNEVLAPMVIDTPNQQEQSLSNYDKIVDLIINHLPKNTQIILCAMDNDILKPFKDKAHIIRLKKATRLLDGDSRKFALISKKFQELSTSN